MDGTFVTALKDAVGAPREHQGRVYVPQGWNDATPKVAAPASVDFATLNGFANFVEANVDELVMSDCLVTIPNPFEVHMIGNLEPEQRFRRCLYARACYANLGVTAFPFGQFMGAEDFFIRLQSSFVRGPEIESLLTLIASIKESVVREVVDDGAAQKVTTAGGVALVGEKKVPNPVTLRPWRTFPEIDQPDSFFVLRMKSGEAGESKPKLALFEADGGAWKAEAHQRVVLYLTEMLGVIVKVVG